MTCSSVKFFGNLAPDQVKRSLGQYSENSYIIDYRFSDRKNPEILNASIKWLTWQRNYKRLEIPFMAKNDVKPLSDLPASEDIRLTLLPKRKSSKKLPVSAFDNTQLSLFQGFLCNTGEQRGQLSNTIALWDSIPRYSVSKQAMNKMRSPEGTLKLLKLDFQYRGQPLKVVIQPARIENGENGETIDYYPSATEELIEDALRKIAADQQQGFFDKSDYRSGAIFTLHMLREELKRRGHSRSFQEIMQSLRILARSSIEILGGDESGGSFAISAYLPALVGVTRKNLEADQNAKWVVQFHPLVTQSIDQVTYRQFNYHQMMSHSTQLARWLHKQLALKFTFASHGRTFDIYFSTIKRDSALLNGYSLTRQAVNAVGDAFDELKEQKVLMLVEKKEVRGVRNKIEDVIWTLSASLDFIASIKAANKRLMPVDKS